MAKPIAMAVFLTTMWVGALASNLSHGHFLNHSRLISSRVMPMQCKGVNSVSVVTKVMAEMRGTCVVGAEAMKLWENGTTVEKDHQNDTEYCSLKAGYRAMRTCVQLEEGSCSCPTTISGVKEGQVVPKIRISPHSTTLTVNGRMWTLPILVPSLEPGQPLLLIEGPWSHYKWLYLFPDMTGIVRKVPECPSKAEDWIEPRADIILMDDGGVGVRDPGNDIRKSYYKAEGSEAGMASDNAWSRVLEKIKSGTGLLRDCDLIGKGGQMDPLEQCATEMLEYRALSDKAMDTERRCGRSYLYGTPGWHECVRRA